MTNSILVTGGAGFVGSFLVDKLISEGNQVKILDNLDPQVHQNGAPTHLNKKAEFIQGDITNYKQVSEAIKDCEIVFNLAAKVGVGQSMYQIKEYVNTNQMGTANLLDAMINKENNIKKMIVASSMSIYGEGSYKDPKTGEIFNNLSRSEDLLKNKEWELKNPKTKEQLIPIGTNEEKNLDYSSIYAINKKNQEEMTLNIGKTYGIPAIALRFFNIYGPRQSLNNPYTGVAAIFMSRIKNNNKPLIFEDGNQSRDFVSVHDVVQACNLSMKKNSGNYDYFNVGTGNQITIKEVAENLIKNMGKKFNPIINEKYRKGDIRHCFADISKIKSKLGYAPKISLNDGIKELIEWSENQSAMDSVDDAYKILKEKKLI